MTLSRGMDRLESARLVLRRITSDDLPFFTRLHASPEVAQHLYPRGRPRSPEETARWLHSTLETYVTFECELGYTLDPAAVWGQGFATEAPRRVRDHARDVLRLPYAISAILPDNARSRRVAERSGARAAGQMEVVGLTWDRWVWPLTEVHPSR